MPKVIPGTPAYRRMLVSRKEKRRLAALVLKRKAKRAKRRAEAAEVATARAKAKDRARKNLKTVRGQDIGKIPPVKKPKRREKAIESFRFFCDTYLPEIFYLPWSKDLLRVIEKIRRVVVDHETLAVAMPRGSGKTMLCLAAALAAAEKSA